MLQKQKISPTITLNGSAVINLAYGQSYVDQGVTATDLKDGSLNAVVSSAEQEADDAELQLTTLKAEQKKLESQFRLFIDRPEGV